MGARVSRTSLTGRRVLAVLVLCIGVTCLAIGAPLLFELSMISRAMSDFRLDEAVENARISRGEKPAIEDLLNPPYLKRYGLDLNLYTDKQGRFLPTGSDWQQWGLRTKAAATVMWLGHDPPGTWWTFGQIRCVDRFYEAYGDSEPIVDVADACLGEPH
ncbi:hypothetical protein GNZ13_44485 [Paraburkholderia sp. 5N]|uniref:Uncharacterized protein n=2 Tax=Paraburkholderia elongata TaxID=2675747 RepID=A0A972SMR0_9BURK|nr:hypothetical protein [Paraburkholderia elongata]